MLHIVNDCNVRLLVASPARLRALLPLLRRCPELRAIVVTGAQAIEAAIPVSGRKFDPGACPLPARAIDADVAAILYTSRSTGKPRGVVLSHRNMVAGAVSVASYLEITPAGRLLAVLPLSFDYLSQLTSAFYRRATAMLINHLFARDIVRGGGRAHHWPGAVPPLWTQLTRLEWPAATTLRYLTNSGVAMPSATLAALAAVFGRWVGVELSAENRLQLWVPSGFAHGFFVTTESAEVQYETTDYWPPEHERAVLWNDPAPAIDRRLEGAPIWLGKDNHEKLLADAEAFA